jgi:nucleotide-binding universal stress UspA family protein
MTAMMHRRTVRGTMAVDAHLPAKAERSATSALSASGGRPLLVVGYTVDAASADALALAALLARVTDGSVLLIAASRSSAGVESDNWRVPALRLIRGALQRIQPTRVREALAVQPNALTATVLDRAAREASSVIVMGAPSHRYEGRGWRQVSRVLRAAPRPVALAPAGYRHTTQGGLARVGVAFDGWPEAWHALAQAVGLARATGAELRVLIVGDPHTAASREPSTDDASSLEGHAQAARRYLDRVVAELPDGLPARGAVLYGPVAAALAEAARTERLDLLVLGSRRLGPAMRVMLGGVSSALAKRPPVRS